MQILKVEVEWNNKNISIHFTSYMITHNYLTKEATTICLIFQQHSWYLFNLYVQLLMKSTKLCLIIFHACMHSEYQACRTCLGYYSNAVKLEANCGSQYLSLCGYVFLVTVLWSLLHSYACSGKLCVYEGVV